MSALQGAGLAILVLAAMLAVGILVWFFLPALRGPEAARKDLGTHRLALAAIVVVVAINGVLTVPLGSVLRPNAGLTTGTFVIAALATDVPMLLVLYLRLIASGALTWRELGLRPIPVDYWLRMGVGTGLVGLVLTDVLGGLLSRVGLRPNQLEEFDFVLRDGPGALVVLLLAAAVMAPFVEELFFRGFIFGLERKRQPLWVAYVVSSGLFTVLHLEPNRMNVQQMAGLSIGVFLLGALLAWLYQHTGSLFPGMLAHTLNNATGLILFYAVGLR